MVLWSRDLHATCACTLKTTELLWGDSNALAPPIQQLLAHPASQGVFPRQANESLVAVCYSANKFKKRFNALVFGVGGETAELWLGSCHP